MTIITDTRFPLHRQGATAFTHSSISRAIVAMIANLRAHVEAERDLEHAGSWDLACDAWLTDAEAAREATLAAVARVEALPVERPEDRVLRHAASLTGALIACDSAQAFGLFQSRIDASARRFAAGTDALSRRLALMMQVLSAVIAEMRDLPDYADTIDAAPAEAIPDAVAPDAGGLTDDGLFEIPSDILDPPFARSTPDHAAAPGPA